MVRKFHARKCEKSGYHSGLNMEAGMRVGSAARFAALAAIPVTLWASHTFADEDRVKTESGVVEGVAASSPGVRVFRGIPFAAPPVGALR